MSEPLALVLLALDDELHAARILITAGQTAIGMGRLPAHTAPAPFILRRARERLDEARARVVSDS